MIHLFQKVLEVKTQQGHGDEEILVSVIHRIKKLQQEYTRVQVKKSIENKYFSENYKSFMTTQADISSKYYDSLLTKCLLDESNINKFIKGNSSRIHKKSKDFFAIYCGFEGYNDFLTETKEQKQPTEPMKTKSNITVTVHQNGNENISIAEVNTDNFSI